MTALTRMRYAFAAVLLAGVAGGTQAQGYPNKVIRVIVGSAAGGGSDLMGRTLAQNLGPLLGQQVVVENRAGAGGRIGAELVARSAPDGHTLLIGTSSLMMIAPALFPKLPYEMLKDIVPVSQLGYVAYVLVVHPSVPAKSVKQLIAVARAHPDKLTFASAGVGASSYLAGELFRINTRLNMLHVPYRASALATLSVISGESDLLFSNILPAVPPIRSGRLRPLGVSSRKRAEQLPEVPTIEESGLPGYEVLQIYALLAPGGTPRAIVSRLNAETHKAMLAPEVGKRLRGDGSEVVVGTPEAMEQLIVSEIRKWGKVIKQAGISVTN